MSKSPKTPQELAKLKLQKKTYSFSLIRSNMDKLSSMADEWGLPVSELVDEAIRHYLEAILETKQKRD